MADDGTVNFAGVRDRLTIAVLGAFFHDQRFDWDADGNLIYRGIRPRHNDPITETDWEIWKFTWSSGNLERLEGPLVGSWDGRAFLGWG